MQFCVKTFICRSSPPCRRAAKRAAPLRVRPLNEQQKLCLGGFDLLDQFGNDLVQVANDAIGSNAEDGGILILVDGDDGLGILHAGNVLDGTRDAQSNIDAGMHGLAGLADLMVSRQPAFIGNGTGSTDNAAQGTSQLFGQGNALLGVRADATANGNNHISTDQVNQLLSALLDVQDLNMDIEIVGCPIIREADGLAKSSRNIYLTPEERKAAVILSKSVALGKKMVAEGEKDAKKIVTAMKELINSEPLATIDYVEMVDMDTMKAIDEVKGHVLCAMAVKFGKARLIDNFIETL